ncbi:MAG: hypothetical protein UW07_C0014G0002 [Candidatus Nomurabacteria bacterium GW2011_GWF2_43_8]|uniref:Nudix hydrolase domain-containing protein n=3 Tax=Candidatus Nomuraibacteriota TaxID=1752729 RepID=A0A0G1FPM6_9BACT|nr:MAG: hypothetical protein UV76_C0004G0033 [Candidatus Nomurabacteria bacterium GW2011_GWA2_43_15]KKT20126.1 MAG: hypothetical protein UW02_C0001G0039 [Candidatus Nomurabacteria bacterium GW2011_GWB1_43_7]KKT24456.1 MAG: hypothetical protein UW07_C0014G0002 [Candidatus Nomurabacteria bacterium GW2011_GWF2_43_8]
MNELANIPEFGIKRENEEQRDGGCAVVFDPKTQKYAVGKNVGDGIFRLFGGGVDKDEDMKEGVLREVVEESGLYDFLYVEEIAVALAHYHNNSKNVNRIAKATCFLVILKSPELVKAKLEEHEKFYLIWSTPEEIVANWEANNKDKNYDHYIYFLKKSVVRAKELGYDTTSNLI